MNLKQCLRDVETGTSGKEHAEWLRTEYQIWTDPDSIAVPSMLPRRTDTLACVKPEVLDKARADAVKVALECQELEKKVDWLRKVHKRTKDHSLGWEKSALLHTRFWVKARADAVKVAQECQELAKQLCFLREDSEEDSMELDKLEKERDELQTKLDIKQRARDKYLRQRNLAWEELLKTTKERDKLQAELDECKKEMWRRGHCGYNGENLQQQIDALQAELDALKACKKKDREIRGLLVKQRNEARAELEAGAKELRRYVEANGFEWCDDETIVFNVTTALGWMGGEIKMCHERLDARDERRCETCLGSDASGKCQVLSRPGSGRCRADGFAKWNGPTKP